MASREHEPGLGSFVRNYFATIVAGILVAGVLAASLCWCTCTGRVSPRGHRRFACTTATGMCTSVEWLDGTDKTDESDESNGSGSREEDLDVISR